METELWVIQYELITSDIPLICEAAHRVFQKLKNISVDLHIVTASLSRWPWNLFLKGWISQCLKEVFNFSSCCFGNININVF